MQHTHALGWVQLPVLFQPDLKVVSYVWWNWLSNQPMGARLAISLWMHVQRCSTALTQKGPCRAPRLSLRHLSVGSPMRPSTCQASLDSTLDMARRGLQRLGGKGSVWVGLGSWGLHLEFGAARAWVLQSLGARVIAVRFGRDDQVAATRLGWRLMTTRCPITPCFGRYLGLVHEISP